MKSTGKVIIMVLVLFIAGSSVGYAQRGMRGMMADSVRMGRPGNHMMHMRHIPMYHPGFGPRTPGLRRLETIPNLTEKQKKDITDLQQIHRTEMQKLREETAASMKSMREANMKKVMDLLSDEQKKYLEENSPIPPTVKK